MSIPDDVRATMDAALTVAREVAQHEFVYGDEEAAQKIFDIDAALEWTAQHAAQPGVQPADWSNAPEWAEWWAVDCGGGAGWYESEPELDHSGFWDRLVGIDGKCIGETQGAGEVDIPLGIDWRTLKQRRPSQPATTQENDHE